MKRKVLRQIRTVGVAEGVSFLLLLGVAMPLKYIWHMPGAVRVLGMLHGLLFTAYVFMALHALRKNWIDMRMAVRMAVASVLPGGPFFIDHQLRDLASEAPASDTAEHH